MALELVSMELAKAQLRIDGTAEDVWLRDAIQGVSDAVALWLKDEWRLYELLRDADGQVVRDSADVPVPLIDSSGEAVVRPAVRRAVLLELASQYRFREGEGDNQVEAHEGHGYVLTQGATRLLAPLRRSTVA